MSDKVYRKKGKPLSIDEKWMVIQVFQHCNKEREQSNSVQTRDAHSRTANYTGVGRRQVVEIIKYFKESGNVLPSLPTSNGSSDQYYSNSRRRYPSVHFRIISEEQIIPTAMKKTELQAWLTQKQIPWEEYWLKPQLIELVDVSIDKTPIVQKIAERKGHKVLLLPIHHPELNPIETIWAIVKNECGKLLRQGIQFKEVRKHLEIAFSNIKS